MGSSDDLLVTDERAVIIDPAATDRDVAHSRSNIANAMGVYSKAAVGSLHSSRIRLSPLVLSDLGFQRITRYGGLLGNLIQYVVEGIGQLAELVPAGAVQAEFLLSVSDADRGLVQLLQGDEDAFSQQQEQADPQPPRPAYPASERHFFIEMNSADHDITPMDLTQW